MDYDVNYNNDNNNKLIKQMIHKPKRLIPV